MANTGYVRERDKEFSLKGISQAVIIADLEKLIPLVTTTIESLSQQQLEAAFPIPFDGSENSTQYVLLQLHAHLNYHLGQVNYLRRGLAVKEG